MKAFNLKFLPIILVLFLFSCQGSTTYRGKWKATTPSGGKIEMEFEANQWSITGSDKKTLIFPYKQYSVSIVNSVETYEISLDDGRSYKIKFPIADDESKGFIYDESGIPIYTISRNDYLKQEDLLSYP